MRNAPLLKCPRCEAHSCQHDERLLADALATQGTGCMNVDVSASYRGIEVSGDHRWTMSLRRYGRTAFVELKRADEPMGLGQEIALHDITGHLTTHLGAAFEQRAFIVRRHGPFTISVSTLTDRKSNRVPPMLKWGTLTTVSNMGSAASVIGRWLADGRLFWDAEAA